MQNKAQSADNAWIKLISDLVKDGTSSVRRSFSTFEIPNYTSVIKMTEPMLTIEDRNISHRFMFGEANYMLHGRNDMTICNSLKAMKRFSDNGIFFNGAYGPMIVDQLTYIIESFEADIFTRQAVLTLWRPNPRKSKDIPCTLTMHFMVNHRDGNIYLDNFVTMRSSDAWLGWVYDVFNFSMVAIYVLNILKAKLKHIKEVHRLKIGNLFLTANNQHLYSEHMDLASNIIRKEKECYNFNNVPFILSSLATDDTLESMNIELFDRYRTDSVAYNQMDKEEKSKCGPNDIAYDTLLEFLNHYSTIGEEYYNSNDTRKEILDQNKTNFRF